MSPTQPATKDIETRADCEQLVHAFYSQAMVDEKIGWLFTEVAKLDLEAHMPIMTSFWETILLGAQSYSGGAFRPHVDLHVQAPLEAEHFGRWLEIWYATVDERFSGERAELAKAHANRVAHAFHDRLQYLESHQAI